MSRKVIPVLILALALAVSPALLAQETSDVYAGRWAEVQTRNIPAGSVNDPGSHLTFILDTGVNARSLLGDVSLVSAEGTVLADLQPYLDVNSDGQLDDGAIMQNFVSITNTHPTMAVTIHFRYYNDNCDDILDFLVILTCNDTLMFDPFNFIVPFSGGENTRDRIFGPQRPGRVLSPIPTREYGSGRFILTAAASGAKRDHVLANTWAEILFPNETPSGLHGECNINRSGTSAHRPGARTRASGYGAQRGFRSRSGCEQPPHLQFLPDLFRLPDRDADRGGAQGIHPGCSERSGSVPCLWHGRLGSSFGRSDKRFGFELGRRRPRGSARNDPARFRDGMEFRQQFRGQGRAGQ
jgi:hypothetical protein